MEKINNAIKIILLAGIIGLCSCTNYHFIDGGVANGKHDCTMWEYFHKQPEDWDSTIVMIEHAGMKEYFDGTLYKQITFFGITNYAIKRFIMDHDNQNGITEAEKWHGIRGIAPDSCAAILKRLIVPEKRLMMSDVPKGRWARERGEDGKLVYKASGGAYYPCVMGEMFCWTYQEDYDNVPEKGATALHMIRKGQNYEGERIVSCNIETTTGVVQALSYNFKFNKL